MRLNNLNAGSLWSFWPFSGFILNCVTLLKLASFNFIDMHEQILAASFGLNEAKTFLIEETRYFTCCHNI